MQTKIVLLFWFFVFSTGWCGGQNLVPNPSFEDTLYCPEHVDSFSTCAEWHSAGQPYFTSPNYFNTCSSNPQVSPPDGVWGYQQPHSGNAFCYLLTYWNIAVNRRETIQATLNQSLTIGQKYFVSFYANFPGIGTNNTASNKLGVLFTTYLFTPTNYAVPNNFAQVYSNTIITDTMNWTHITGSFVADSAYQYISLGNFFDDAHTDTSIFFIGGSQLSAYLIDDICVSTDSMQCYSETGINNYSDDKPIRVFPNPSYSSFSIICPQIIHQIQGYNSLGSMVVDLPDVGSNEITIDCAAWAEGIYFLKIDDHLFKQLIIH